LSISGSFPSAASANTIAPAVPFGGLSYVAIALSSSFNFFARIFAADCIAAWPAVGTRIDVGFAAPTAANSALGLVSEAPAVVIPASKRKSRRVVDESVGRLAKASLLFRFAAWMEDGRTFAQDASPSQMRAHPSRP
jgi:hypothetical protein